MGINYRRNRVGGVMKSIYKLKGKRQRECEEEKKGGPKCDRFAEDVQS